MDLDEVRRAAQFLKEGKLVAFPTETVYGLGAHALDVDAVERIYRLKQRPHTSPLIVHASDIEQIQALVSAWPSVAQRLAEQFWPGPLTLVLPKKAHVPDLVTAGRDTVGVRIPAHRVALELLKQAQIPIAAPSANRFTHISPTTAEHVRHGIPLGIDLILDGGACQVGIESTVVSLTETIPVVLRPGMISAAEIERATGLPCATLAGVAKDSSLAPGLHPRHYSPCTPLHLVSPGAKLPPGRGRLLSLTSDARLFAEQLYAELHAADEAGWDWIAIEDPPDTSEWAGIRDRLIRASQR